MALLFKELKNWGRFLSNYNVRQNEITSTKQVHMSMDRSWKGQLIQLRK